MNGGLFPLQGGILLEWELREGHHFYSCHIEQKELLSRIVSEDHLMHGNLLHDTVQMEVLRLKVLILINHTVQWHMLTHSDIASMHRITAGILDVSNAFKTQMFLFIKEFVSVHTPSTIS